MHPSKSTRHGTPAEILEAVAAEQGETLAGLSRFIGRRDGYLQSFIARGYPASLPRDARQRLAKYLGIPEWQLGDPDDI